MLAQRLITAAIGIPLILAVVLLGGPLYTAVAAAILAIAAIELLAAVDKTGRPLWQPSLPAFVAAAGCIALAIAADNDLEAPELAVVGALGLVALIALARRSSSSSGSPATPRASPFTIHHSLFTTLAAIAYIGLLGSYIVLLRDLHDGRDWLLLALLGTWGTDTAAYAVGKTVGRHKMAPSISPGKTWEGTIGALIGGLGVIVALNWPLDLPMTYGEAAILGAVLPATAVLADLGESMLKRGVGVKDTSELVPGHGGFLDRLDSLLFTVPLVYYFADWIVL